MSYSFAPFLDSLNTNWYADDALLARLLARYSPEGLVAAGDRLGAFGAQVAGELRELADESARPENAPYLRHFDPYSRRVDEVVLPGSTQRALAEVEGGHKLGALQGDPFVFYAMSYLYSQNGEAGVGCSMACTDGLVRATEALGDRPEHREAVARIRGSSRERVFHAAQFVTEIQGGSDVPANILRAEPDGDDYRLHGQKWFCSNINADYFLVTARPDGAPDDGRGVALFLVPAYLDAERPLRNGYVIDRLKDKLGTRELATAEVTFAGARAYPLGPLDRGIANVVNYVLVTSRFACASFAAATLRRAERIAAAYADFRTAFGQKLSRYPLVREQVAALRGARERALATLFELARLWLAGQTDPKGEEARDFRFLMSLAKPVLTRQATEQVHEAMMLLAGNGIEERFSPLPRLYRDSVIMETWEGPHNLLFSQALRDMARFEVDPKSFVARVAGESRRDLTDELGQILSGAQDLEATVPFARFGEKLIRALGERVLAETK